MRAILLASVVAVGVAGCANDTLDDTAYRRLVDQFDSYDQCLSEGNFAQCYQTLTFCSDGLVNANLEIRQQGKYEVVEQEAIAKLTYMTLHFDLDKMSSDQLPGKHPWEVVTPLYYDCAQ